MFAGLRDAFFGGKKKSNSLAKSRLHFVLVQDRTGLTNDEMASFKSEMIDVIEKYFVIDKHAFDLAYERQGETTTLLINSPVVVKRQDSPNHQAGAHHNSKNKNARNKANKAKQNANQTVNA